MLVSEFLGSPQSEGIYLVGPESSRGSSVIAATGKDAAMTLAAFEATYGESPTSPYWAYAYDAATLLLTAIESAAVAKGGTLHLDRAGLREAMGAMAGFQRITGVLSCGVRRLRHGTHQHLPPYGLSHYRRRAACGGLPVQPLRGPVHVQASDCTCRSVPRRVGRMSGR